jgi:hypothetical protein
MNHQCDGGHLAFAAWSAIHVRVWNLRLSQYVDGRVKWLHDLHSRGGYGMQGFASHWSHYSSCGPDRVCDIIDVILP